MTPDPLVVLGNSAPLGLWVGGWGCESDVMVAGAQIMPSRVQTRGQKIRLARQLDSVCGAQDVLQDEG